MYWNLSALFVGGVEESLGSWVPIPVLISALSVAVGLVVLLVKYLFALQEKHQRERDNIANEAQRARDDATARRLEAIDSTLKSLGEQSHAYMRVDAAGRMGDRFDERIGDLRERMKVVEGAVESNLDRIKQLEAAERRRERG